MSDKKKIMIVDDDREFLEELKEILESAGYDVLEVSDNSSIIRTAVKARPDGILIDLKMSPRSGFQVADELKGRTETSKIPIIAMSAFFTREEDELLRNVCGITEQVDKPFNPLDVIAVIERTVGNGGSKKGY